MTTLIKIKESAPYALASGYGREYSARISKKSAIKLAGVCPVPAMGHAVTVAIAPKFVHGLEFTSILEVQNISGDFYLASPHEPLTAWPEVFRVTVIRTGGAK